MTTKLETFSKPFLREKLPDLRPGDTIRVYQKIKDYNSPTASSRAKGAGPSGDKERVQVFEGLIIARKHGKGINSTITVRKTISGVGVERVFPIHSPLIEKIEVVKREKVRRAKLYYLRETRGKKARLKRKEFTEPAAEEVKTEEVKIDYPSDSEGR